MILIAGPCVIENKKTLKKTVESLLKAISNKKIDFYFKSSFNKDNRTKFENFRGLDSRVALSYLEEIKKEYGVKICTDFHTMGQLDLVTEFDIDIIQIPAYLARQKSLIEYAIDIAKTNKKILFIKKPQFIGPTNISDIIDNKLMKDLNIFIADRGTMFGYNQTFMDPRHIPIMKNNKIKVLGDITHPNKNYPGDLNENIEALGKSYIAAGADGLFMETHPNCKKALCDADTMLQTKFLEEYINKFYKIYNIIREER